jgi:hypothetical protein
LAVEAFFFFLLLPLCPDNFFFTLYSKRMSAVLGTIAKWAIPVGLAVGGAQAAMYDGNF